MRTLIVFCLHTACRTVIPEILIRRVERKSLVIVGNSAFIVAYTNTGDTTKVIEQRDVWIKLYRLGNISLSTMIVVKVVLRNSPHLPWLIEIWLHRYYLIEILYA